MKDRIVSHKYGTMNLWKIQYSVKDSKENETFSRTHFVVASDGIEAIEAIHQICRNEGDTFIHLYGCSYIERVDVVVNLKGDTKVEAVKG